MGYWGYRNRECNDDRNWNMRHSGRRWNHCGFGNRIRHGTNQLTEMKTKDLAIGGDWDLSTTTGDLSVGNTSLQNQALILHAQKGEWKEHPYLGAGIADKPNDEENAYWRHRITEELRRDGCRVEKITISNNNIEITAEYPDENH